MYSDYLEAARGNPALERVLADMHERLEALTQVVPVTPQGTPPACRFTVTGEDGNFVIEIVNPQHAQPLTVQQRIAATTAEQANYYGVAVTHELHSATTRYFDADGDVRTYGPDTKTRWEITDTPDQSRYWRLRSSYDGGKTWGRWQEHLDPALCGAVPVSSRQVRSTRLMPRTVVNTTNFATVNSTISGGFGTIRVYGTGGLGSMWYRKVGGVLTGPYPATDDLSGYTIGETYSVYYDRENELFRVFDASEHAESLDDRYIYAGTVTVGTTGSGTDAAATAFISSGQVVSVSIDDPGSDYVSAPAVGFSGGGGSGAAAYATISGGEVTAVIITSGGSGYATPPAVSFTGGRDGVEGGGGATGGLNGNPLFGESLLQN